MKKERIFILLCIFFIMDVLYMKYGKVRPYCNLCIIDSKLEHWITISNVYWYIMIDSAFALSFLFHYNKNSLFLTKLSAIGGFIYLISWLPYDLLMLNRSLIDQVKWMQSDKIGFIYCIIIFIIAILLGCFIAHKLDKNG